MKRRTRLAIIACLTLGGCDTEPSAAPTAPARGSTSGAAASADPELSTFQLYVRPDKYETPCVFVTQTAVRDEAKATVKSLLESRARELPAALVPCFETQADLRAAHPQLHEQTSAMNLASALVHLQSTDIVDAPRLYTRPRSDGSKLLSPFDLGEHSLWDRSTRHERVADDALRLPAFSDDRSTLTYDVSNVTRPERGSFVVESERVTVAFGESEWTQTAEALPTEDLQAPRTAIVEKALGGSAKGLMAVPLEKGTWYVVLEPEAGASPFAWRGNDEAIVRHGSITALLEAQPAVASEANKVALAKVLSRHFIDGDFQPIRDGAAWKALYRKTGQSTQTRRAYDQGYYDEFVHYSVTDFETIAAPAFEGSTFTVFFEGRNKQPYHASVDLAALTTTSKIEPKFMATFTVTSDRDGPMPEPEPEP